MEEESSIIPDLYFPDEDQDLQTSRVEGQGQRGQGGGLEGGNNVDLAPEGFIPIHKLTLGDLPEPIRTEDNLQLILDFGKIVVKVHNNALSAKRPDNDQFKERKQRNLTGSGILQTGLAQGVAVTTNRHVLYNEEELSNSNFEVFYDYNYRDPSDVKKLAKRCARTNGKCFDKKSSKDDLVIAKYRVKDAMVAHIKEHCTDYVELLHRLYAVSLQSPPGDPNRKPVVCLISHPLGQPKQVSFGEMVDYNVQSRTLHHTAPSQPGSSGGPVLVFSNRRDYFPLHAHHVGTDRRKGYKFARVDKSDSSRLDVTEGFYKTLNDEVHASENQAPKITPAMMAQGASTNLDIAVLTAFVPLFGAFILQAEETRLAGLDASAVKPCKPFLTQDTPTSRDLKSVKKIAQKLTQAAPSFTPNLSDDVDDVADMAQLLQSQGSCFCQSIVRKMERGLNKEDGAATERYLSPYTAAAKMSSDVDVTWPWLRRSSCDVRDDDKTDDCLMEKCAQLCDRDNNMIILLLMVTKANACIKELLLQPRNPPSPCVDESPKETLTSTSDQGTGQRTGGTQAATTLTSKEKPRASVAGSEENWQSFLQDISTFCMISYASYVGAYALRLLGNFPTVCQERAEDEYSKLFSRFLAVHQHYWQHEKQTHRDTETTGEGGGSSKRCRCGRPGAHELVVAYGVLMATFSPEQVKKNKQRHLKSVLEIHFLLKEINDISLAGDTTGHFHRFVYNLQHDAYKKSLHPGISLFIALDNVGEFPQGSQAPMLLLASGEALFYNSCLLLRRITKCIQFCYFAFPVSVYGRPGGWPGNVTPAEVQRTAWRLIQEAIMASGFRPALLSALEKDADRREKLIDLYVDMKQLKWEGRIQPRLFAKYLRDTKRNPHNCSEGTCPLEDTTYYFVWYAAYLVCPEFGGYRRYGAQPPAGK